MSDAKLAIDKIIGKGRVHLYKPIQIAEILYRSRVFKDIDLDDLESYRNRSKQWRDTASKKLVGNVSTSSQKFQDNLFEENAMLPQLLEQLDKINISNNGMVENYIYHQCKQRWSLLIQIDDYLSRTNIDDYKVEKMVNWFTTETGLKKSIDKVYEVSVHALFTTIVEELKAKVSLEIENPDEQILNDFKGFIRMVLGIKPSDRKISLPAMLYRAGVTNAADKGIDIWTNFGPVVQVKHLCLTKDEIDDIVDSVVAERIIIVCLDAEKDTIRSVLNQIGWSNRIQGIITLNDLKNWYDICLRKYASTMGKKVLKCLRTEFRREFPMVTEIDAFFKERGYEPGKLAVEWKIGDQAKLFGLG